jgi:hypothetical protein
MVSMEEEGRRTVGGARVLHSLPSSDKIRTIARIVLQLHPQKS